MPSHYWGDESFDWKGLGKSEGIIRFWGKQVGRIGGDLKEKYGTIRWYTNPGGVERLYELTHPGYYGYFWGAEDKPVWNVIDNMSYVYIRFLNPLIKVYKRFFYAYAYHRAVKAFPELYQEILACCECDKLLFKYERELYKSLRSDEKTDE